MKKIPTFLPAALSLLFLSGCVEPIAVGAGGEVGIMYLTKPSEPPPADTADQIPPHESWCYKTMGEEVECFAEPQDTPPGRLLNVDPPNRYPLTAKAYADALEQNRQAHMPPAPPAPTADAAPIGAQPVVVAPVTPQVAPAQLPPPPKAATTTKKHKKKHKKPAKPKTQVTPSAPSVGTAPPPAISN